MNNRPAWVEIDLNALRYNVKEIKNKVGEKCKVMAVVKANGYGHGAVAISRVALSAGADALAVSILSEAIELRSAGFMCPILILGWTIPESYRDAIENRIILTLYDLKDARRLNDEAARLHKKAKVHLKIDTGMSRLGILPNDDGLEIARQILQLPNLEVEGIFSHFSKADEADKSYTQMQLKQFLFFVHRIEEECKYRFMLKHIANSAAIMELPESYLDMVRPGIILYGGYPSDEVDRTQLKLEPSIVVKAMISRVQKLPEGVLVGYGGSYKTTKETIVATIPVGYADGYNRHLSNNGFVGCRGKLLPIIGKICMDQFMVDATEIDDIQPGEEVVLVGEKQYPELSVEKIAQRLDTIPYEVTCNFVQRLMRIYIEE